MNDSADLPTMTVLVVEDNPSVASLLQRGLEREGYSVDLAGNGREALELGMRNTYVAIVLDVMIPAPDGLEVVRRLRQRGQWVPVLMLTARDRVEDRVAGLQAGADDYLGKPFSVRELSARLHALSRRASYDRPNVLQAGEILLDPVSHEARRGSASVPLSSREFDLLAELMRHAGDLLADNYLSEHVFGAQSEGGAGTVAFYIDRLREKLDEPFDRALIRRRRGVARPSRRPRRCHRRRRPDCSAARPVRTGARAQRSRRRGFGERPRLVGARAQRGRAARKAGAPVAANTS